MQNCTSGLLRNACTKEGTPSRILTVCKVQFPLFAGATLERTGGRGVLVNAFVGDRRPSSEIVSLFNLPEPIRKASIQISLSALLEHYEKGAVRILTRLLLGDILWRATIDSDALCM